MGFQPNDIALIAALFFLIAALYSSVGFGGGSSYIAILALFAFSYLAIPQTALFCNIVVVTGGCYLYFKNKILKLNLAMPYLVSSIPLAFIGGKIPIEKELYFLLLALVLLYSGLRMLIFPGLTGRKAEFLKKSNREIHPWLTGGVVGFISGLIGIGGGIILAPLLHLAGRHDAKNIAAISSFFILANSLAGLGGQLSKSGLAIEPVTLIILGTAVFLGGQLGSRWSNYRLPDIAITRLTATLVLFVALRILFQL